MTARKIRMTAVGLVAMPADRDERTVTADDLASDPLIFTAWAELHEFYVPPTDYFPVDQIEAWERALDAANGNDIEALRRALEHARTLVATAEGSAPLEDAALAMLPPVAGRRAA